MLMALLCHEIIHAQQNIGIGTTAPDASAMLDIKSNSKGILIPRMSATERLVPLEAGVWTVMSITVHQAGPMKTEATDVCTRMTMWQECRGLTIRNRSQSRTLPMNADELTVTAIRR